MQNFAKTTPFEFSELVTASQKLQGVGFAAENVIPTLKDVGSALAASGRIGDLPFAIKALGDIQAKGKLAGQEIIQLANAGVPAIKVLSGALGKTNAEVLALSENGQISSEVFLKALHQYAQSNFGGALEAQSKTFGGAMSNIKDALGQTSEVAFRPLYEKVSSLAGDIATEVGRNENDLTKVGETIAKSIARGFGEILSDEINREIADIKEGKGNPFALVNATNNLGASFQEGAFGKRGNLKDLIESSYNLSFGNNFSNDFKESDLQNLETINFFEKFDAQINALKTERDKRLKELGDIFAPFAENLNKNLNLNGVEVTFDPLTNTLKQIQTDTKNLGNEFGKTAKEASKLSEAVNKFNLSGVDNYLEYGKAKINAGGGSDLAKIREQSELEQFAIKEKSVCKNSISTLRRGLCRLRIYRVAKARNWHCKRLQP